MSFFKNLRKAFNSDAASTTPPLASSQRLLEAIAAGCVMVAYADGTCSDGEVDRIERLLKANDSLKPVLNLMSKTINSAMELMEAGPRLGQTKLMRELDKIKDEPDQVEEAIASILTVAESDNDISKEELRVIALICERLGTTINNYLDAEQLSVLKA